MSSFDPITILDVFNPANFTPPGDSLTLATADKRYLRISGGNVGYLNVIANMDAASYSLGGAPVDLSAISGVVAGTASASKALIVDSSRNIVNINALTASQLTGTLQTAAQPNITSLGTLTTLNLNGSFNFGSNVNTTMNNNLIITGSASSPTTTNGIGVAFSPLLNGGEGRIKAFNYIMSSFNNINVNEGTIYCKKDKTVAIGHTSPAYQLDVASGYVNSVSGYKLNGSDAITSSGITGTLQTAAQPNITSLGTLTTKLSILTTTNDGITIRNSDTTQLSNVKFISGIVGSSNTWEVGCRGSGAAAPLSGFYIYNGAMRFTISSSGNVGLGGQTAASRTLDITGDIQATTNGCIGGKLRVGSTTTADFPIHISASGNDRLLCLYNTATNLAFYGLGASANAMIYSADLAHRWYLNSKGDTTGTKWMDLSSTQLSLSMTTDATSTTTGSFTTAGGMSCQLQCVAGKFSTTGQMVCNQLNVGGYLSTVNGNELNFNSGAVAGTIKPSTTVVVDSNQDVGAFRRLKAQQLFAGNDYSDTGRLITAYDSTTVAGNIKYLLCGGQASSANNACELSYYHSANGSSNNEFRIGYNGGVLTRFRFDGAVLTGAGTQMTNSSGEWVSKVNTSNDVIVNGSGRLRSNSPLGMQIYNSDYNDTEGRIYCSSYNMYVGTQGNGSLRLITTGSTRMYIGDDSMSQGNICFHGTSTSYPVSILKSDGSYSGSYHYWSSSGSNGSSSSTGSTVSLFLSGRAVVGSEIDVASDRRLKKDIEYINDDLVNDFVDNAVPRVFRYKKETDLSYGYVAQELIKKGFTRFVQCHKNDELEETIDDDGFVSQKGVQYCVNTGYFIPLMHLKIKQMDKTIKDLTERLNRMSNI